MTVTYLITLTDRDAQFVDRWCDEVGIRVGPATGHPGFGVEPVDVVRDPEGPPR